jgi:hypothetical protein
MLLKLAPALTAVTFAFCASVDPAAAQAPNCGAMYSQVMGLYQTAPQSPQYAQMAAAYSASCVGPSAGPAYPAPGYGYTPGYYAPGYAYAPPIAVGVGIGYGGGWGGGWRR